MMFRAEPFVRAAGKSGFHSDRDNLCPHEIAGSKSGKINYDETNQEGSDQKRDMEKIKSASRRRRAGPRLGAATDGKSTMSKHMWRANCYRSFQRIGLPTFAPADFRLGTRAPTVEATAKRATGTIEAG